MLVKYKDVENSLIANDIYFCNFKEITDKELSDGIEIEVKVRGREVNFMDFIKI